MLDDDLWVRFELAHPDVARMLELLDEPTISPTDSTIHDRAILPFIDWESRIDRWFQQQRIDESTSLTLKDRVAQHRVVYLQRLQEIMDELGSSRRVTILTRPKVAVALHEWAKHTELWKYY